MVNNIEGLGLDIDDDLTKYDDEKKNEHKDHKKQDKTTVHDLQNAMKTMTSLFLEKNRPTDDENEPCNSRVEPIVDQMKDFEISESHKPSVLFSLLPGPARKDCKILKRHALPLEQMLDEIRKKILFDDEVKDRRVIRWTSVTFSKLRQNCSSEEQATRKCLEFVTEYQKDIPKHILAEKHLYTPICSISRSVLRYETLFQRTKAHENASSFGQKLISAAANHDIRSKNQTKSSTLFQASSGTSTLNLQDSQWSDLIAFFSKTPPPPGHRRPGRFNHGPLNQGRSHQGGFARQRPRHLHRPHHQSQRPHWMRPQALSQSRFRPGKICFG